MVPCCGPWDHGIGCLLPVLPHAANAKPSACPAISVSLETAATRDRSDRRESQGITEDRSGVDLFGLAQRICAGVFGRSLSSLAECEHPVLNRGVWDSLTQRKNGSVPPWLCPAALHSQLETSRAGLWSSSSCSRHRFTPKLPQIPVLFHLCTRPHSHGARTGKTIKSAAENPRED